MTPLAPWYIALSPGKEGHLFVELFYSQIEQTSIEFKGHSFLGCLLVHLGKKMAKGLSASSCFFLICKASIFMARICNISLLRTSSMLPISPLMDEWEEKVSLPTFMFLAIGSRGMFSSSSSPIGSSNMSVCYLRVFLDCSH